MKQMELFEDTTDPKRPPEKPTHSGTEYSNISFMFEYRGVPQYLSAQEALSLHSQLSKFVEDLDTVKRSRATVGPNDWSHPDRVAERAARVVGLLKDQGVLDDGR